MNIEIYKPVNETGRRWTPACTMLLVSPIGYIDRNTLALLVSRHLAGNRDECRAIRLPHLGVFG